MGFILSKLNNYHRRQFYNRDSLILQEIKSSYITEAKKEMEKNKKKVEIVRKSSFDDSDSEMVEEEISQYP